MAVGGGVGLVADALPHAGQARGAALVVVGRVAGHLVGRPQVGPLGLDPVPVHVGRGVGLGHLDLAALAGVAGLDHCGQHGQRGQHRADVDAHVGHVRRDAGEALVVDDGLHDPRPGVVGDAVAGHVLVRAGGPVARQGGEHKPGVGRRQHVVAEAQSGQRAGTHGLHHHVGGGGQIDVEPAASLVLEVEGDAALAPVGVQVQQRHALDDGPGHLADVVARGRLDLDHVGAQVGQKRAQMARPEQARLDHPHPGQQPAGLGSRLVARGWLVAHRGPVYGGLWGAPAACVVAASAAGEQLRRLADPVWLAHGSMRTPGLRMPLGSRRFLTARMDSANKAGRWRS